MNQINILPFGSIADITGSEAFQLAASNTDDLRALLGERFPELESRKYAIAVNKVIVKSNTLLDANSVIALLPPYSGG
jgi:molybdopterin synthase sulfur carrier subunit